MKIDALRAHFAGLDVDLVPEPDPIPSADVAPFGIKGKRPFATFTDEARKMAEEDTPPRASDGVLAEVWLENEQGTKLCAHTPVLFEKRTSDVATMVPIVTLCPLTPISLAGTAVGVASHVCVRLIDLDHLIRVPVGDPIATHDGMTIVVNGLGLKMT